MKRWRAWIGSGRRGARRACLAAAAALAGALGPAAAAGPDLLGPGWVGGDPGEVVAVPVFVRDAAGTWLDEGAGPDLEIQGFAFRIDFAPASEVVSIDFAQAGVTAGKDAVFPIVTPADDHIIVLLNFDETTDPLGFTLDRPPPGDVVGMLLVELSPTAPTGIAIELTVAPATASLVNGSATLEETVANGQLATVDGRVTVGPLIFADGFESGDTSAWTREVP